MPDPDRPGAAAPFALQQDRTVAALSRHFAADALSLEEFERRLDLAVRASSSAELEALTADLPAAPPPAPRPAAAGRSEEEREGRQHIVAIMGGNTRAGAWKPRRKIFAYAFWGGAELDFREADLPPGTTSVVAVAIMGGVDIVVPPGVDVEVNGTAVMGAVEQVHDVPATGGVLGAGGESAPTEIPASEGPARRVRVTVLALMGGVQVDVRHPGESSGEARRRRRQAEKDRRRERGRER